MFCTTCVRERTSSPCRICGMECVEEPELPRPNGRADVSECSVGQLEYLSRHFPGFVLLEAHDRLHWEPRQEAARKAPYEALASGARLSPEVKKFCLEAVLTDKDTWDEVEPPRKPWVDSLLWNPR